MKIRSLILTVLVFASVSSFSQVDLSKGTVFEVLCLAKEQNKIIMVDVMTEWCKWCVELDNKVYAKSEDIAMQSNQINYKIDGKRGRCAFAKI
jgi:thiol:disulfide interchange protein